MKVTLIVYNDESSVTFTNKAPNTNLLNNIGTSEGGTNFEYPLHQAYMAASNTQMATDTYYVYFLSDGTAAYPKKAIGDFMSNNDLRYNTHFYSVGVGLDADYDVL